MKKTTITLVDDYAKKLTHLLGKNVFVLRERYNGKLNYYLEIEGCHPNRFGPMSISEVKGRLAMLLDMLMVKVIQKG